VTTHRAGADDSTSTDSEGLTEGVPDQEPTVDRPLVIGTTSPELLIERISNEFGEYVGRPLSDLVSQRAADHRLVVVPLAPSPQLGFALLPQGRPATHPQRPSTVIDEVPDLSGLSARERSIVSRLMAGDRAPAIAEALQLSQSTVRNHLSAVFRKLGVRSQQELIDLLSNRTAGTDRGGREALSAAPGLIG
jgi:DNA-binding CsgD family transcriptional regulator